MARTAPPVRNARRALIRELLQKSNVSSMEDVQNLFMEHGSGWRPETPLRRQPRESVIYVQPI